MKRIFLFLFFAWTSAIVNAQYRLSGRVTDEDKVAITGAVIELQQDTTLVGAVVADRKGDYAFGSLNAGTYTITVSCYGYSTINQKINIVSDTRQDFVMEGEGEGQLDEVVIIADRSQIVTTNATGTTFYLSSQAKKMTNPYEALREIPVLNVRPSEKTITLANGVAPLVLINGVRYNAGLDTIDPAEVEDVEVIENPSVRYLQEGITAIINIKTKKRANSFQSLNLNASHMLPILFGFTGGAFEIGNDKASVGLSVDNFYYHDDKSEWIRNQRNTGYEKNFQGERVINSGYLNIALNADLNISQKEYLVFNVTYRNSPNKQKYEAKGTYIVENNEAQDFNYWNNYDIASRIGSLNLYYRHSFASKTYVEVTGRFNLNSNETKSDRREEYRNRTSASLFDYDNSRNSGGLDLLYTMPVSTHTLNIGNQLRYVNDRLRQLAAGYPTFHSRNWDEYLYGEMRGNLTKKLTYTASLGINMIFRNSAGINHHYIRPVENLSFNYRFNSIHTLNASYQLRNVSPSISQLNPYNTSTDSLSVTKGNPYLSPSKQYQWRIRHTYNNKGFYIEPSVTYTLYTDIVSQAGETDLETGIYTRTYKNLDHYRYLSGAVNARYRDSKWGYINAGITNVTRFYEGQSGKNLFVYSFGFSVKYDKWTLSGSMRHTPKDYTINSKIKSRGSDAEVNLNFSATKNLMLFTSIRYMMGAVIDKTYMHDGSFYNYTYYKNVDRSYCFMLGFSYNLRKHSGKSRNKKTLSNTESGISL